MPASIGAIYIAPLKSLINDQFGRISELCMETGIPVYHWHGDVAASHKQKALKNPRGILQITPESLEAMLITRSSDLIRLFGDLRYVVIAVLIIHISDDLVTSVIAKVDIYIGHTDSFGI